jgi:hypothetical protein
MITSETVCNMGTWSECREPFREVERRRPRTGDTLGAERGEERPEPSEMDISGSTFRTLQDRTSH